MSAAAQPPRNLLKVGFYEVEATIGKGNYACVKLARHRVTKTEVAIKIVDKARLDADNLKKVYREIEVLKSLNHPHIIKLYQVMETKNILYLVTEYAPNGEIFDLIARQHRLTEEDARYKFWQIISAVDYCHKKGIVHRDLKAENLLLDCNFRLKIADFGFSTFFKGDEQLNTFCGSPPYAAPEVFEGKKYHATHIDIWSLGVVLYVLVCGALPFEGANIQELRDRVISGRFRIPFFMSGDCENLIRRMLNVDPLKRPTMEQIRAHKWMQVDNLEAKIQSEIDTYDRLSLKEPQAHILNLMHGMGIDQNRTKVSLKNVAYDNFMAIYQLLFERWRAATLDPMRSRVGEMMPRTLTDPEIHKDDMVLKRARPLLHSLRDHSTFRTTDTTASSGFGEERAATLSRQSTIGTIGSIDEGVEIDSSPVSRVTFSSGEMIGDTMNQCTFESFESPLETDLMSSLSSCPNRSDGSTQSQGAAPLMNTSMNSCGCTPEPGPSSRPSSFGQGWRASDNTMFHSVHSPFPTGQLSRGRGAMGECSRLRPSNDAMEKLQKMRISQRSPPERRNKNTIATLSKRISLPENLEFQPQKLLNIKQSMHVEQQLGEGSCIDNKAVLKARFQQKQRQMKTRMQFLRQQSYQMAQKQSVLPNGALATLRDDMDDRLSLSPTLLSPIEDSHREDSMDIA